MVEQTGKSESERLIEIARDTHKDENPVENNCNGSKMNRYDNPHIHVSASSGQ